MTVLTGWVLAVPEEYSRGWGLAAAIAVAVKSDRNPTVRYEGHEALWANRYRWTDGDVVLIEPREG